MCICARVHVRVHVHVHVLLLFLSWYLSNHGSCVELVGYPMKMHGGIFCSGWGWYHVDTKAGFGLFVHFLHNNDTKLSIRNNNNNKKNEQQMLPDANTHTSFIAILDSLVAGHMFFKLRKMHWYTSLLLLLLWRVEISKLLFFRNFVLYAALGKMAGGVRMQEGDTRTHHIDDERHQKQTNKQPNKITIITIIIYTFFFFCFVQRDTYMKSRFHCAMRAAILSFASLLDTMYK